MTREEIENTPEVVDRLLDKCVLVDSRAKLRKRLEEVCDIAIKALEPKTGHWIMTSDYLTTAYGSIDYVKCSCCGEDSLEEGDYCPNCGCRMSEGSGKE